MKFSVPKEALSLTTEYNLGFCKEVQRGVVDTSGRKQHYYEVDWDSCVEYVTFAENPEDSLINITKCKEQPGYDWSHDYKDGMLDISKCMEGNITNLYHITMTDFLNSHDFI